MLKLDGVCKRYQVTAVTIWRWRKAGIFPNPIKIGKGVRWREEDLDAFDKSSEAEMMKIDDREMAETIAEAKSDPGWTDDRGMIIKLLKEHLELPDDTSDSELLGWASTYFDKCAGIKNLFKHKKKGI